MIARFIHDILPSAADWDCCLDVLASLPENF